MATPKKPKPVVDPGPDTEPTPEPPVVEEPDYPIPVYFKRNPEQAAAIQKILGLPNDRWDDVQVEFGHDNIATARVSLFLIPEQLLALAAVATESPVPENRLCDECHTPLAQDATLGTYYCPANRRHSR